MSPGFFLDVVEAPGNLFQFVILIVKDLKDIHMRYHYPMMRCIICPRYLDYGNTSNVLNRVSIIFVEQKGEHFVLKKN